MIPAVIRRSVAVSFLIALVMGAFAMPALAGGRQVLADYEDNGQIDGCYTLAEYEEALKLIRPDQQQYGAAVDVIRQAELTNIRRPGQACGGTSASGASADANGGGTGTSTAGGNATPSDPAALPDDGVQPVVIAVIVVAVLAVIAFIVYLAVARRRRGGGGDADGGAGA